MTARLVALSLAFLACDPARALAQSQLVIVSGLGGQPQYTRAFAQLSTTLAQAAHERWGMPDSAITWLGDTAATKSRWYRGASLRDNIDRTLARLAARPRGERIVLVLIGHGSGEGEDTRISLPGPDMTARDFARVLARFGDRGIAFVNLTSASGDMLPLLAAPGRVVITATKSAFERNESQFARFFVDALSRDGADSDKDGRVSLLEAFTYAQQETKRFYENDSRLATEHAQIADAGDLARRFFLAGQTAAVRTTASAPTSSDPRVAALYAELQGLKARKRSMTADAYERELERVLLAIALRSRELRQSARGSE